MRTITLKSFLILIILCNVTICNAQKQTHSEGITAKVSFLGSYQEKSSKLPTDDAPSGQFIWNHELYYQFYKATTSKLVYSLRSGIGVKFKHQETKFPKYHFDIHFVYFFTPYNDGLITQAFGISFGWKWYFQK